MRSRSPVADHEERQAWPAVIATVTRLPDAVDAKL